MYNPTTGESFRSPMTSLDAETDSEPIIIFIVILLLLTCLSVALDDVAGVVELGEGSSQLVEVVAEGVEEEVGDTAQDHLREFEDELGQLPLLGVLQLHGVAARFRTDLLGRHVCCARYRPVTSTLP